jgi:hypothetical protein
VARTAKKEGAVIGIACKPKPSAMPQAAARRLVVMVVAVATAVGVVVG